MNGILKQPLALTSNLFFGGIQPSTAHGTEPSVFIEDMRPGLLAVTSCGAKK